MKGHRHQEATAGPSAGVRLASVGVFFSPVGLPPRIPPSSHRSRPSKATACRPIRRGSQDGKGHRHIGAFAPCRRTGQRASVPVGTGRRAERRRPRRAAHTTFDDQTGLSRRHHVDGVRRICRRRRASLRDVQRGVGGVARSRANGRRLDGASEGTAAGRYVRDVSASLRAAFASARRAGTRHPRGHLARAGVTVPDDRRSPAALPVGLQHSGASSSPSAVDRLRTRIVVPISHPKWRGLFARSAQAIRSTDRDRFGVVAGHRRAPPPGSTRLRSRGVRAGSIGPRAGHRKGRGGCRDLSTPARMVEAARSIIFLHIRLTRGD